MRFSTIVSSITTLFLASVTLAVDVACVVDGTTVAVVDLDTGVCPFALPEALSAFFNFNAGDDYDVQFYYAIAQNTRYFTDIVNAGRTINIPAIILYGNPGAPCYQVHRSKSPETNSTAAIRKRLLGDTYIKRDEASDLAESLKSEDGVLVGDSVFEVLDINPSSSSSSSSGTTSAPGTSTATESSTKIITITSCSEDKCSETTVPATKGPTTVTTHGTVTTYTTWCPISTVTDKETKIITVTSCSENKCSEHTVPATKGPTTVTTHGVVTTYTTWCPVTDVPKTVIKTVTSCADNKCSPVPVTGTEKTVTVTEHGVVTHYTTWDKITSTPTVSTLATSTPKTVAPSSQGTISIYSGAAVKLSGSFLALVAIPLAYLL